MRPCRFSGEIGAAGGHDFAFTEKRIGGIAIKQDGSPLPVMSWLDAAFSSDAVFLGAVGSPEFNSLPSNRAPEAGLLQLRAALGGFANLRPAFAFKELAVNSPLKPEIIESADILFVRELLGGLYWRAARVEQGDWPCLQYHGLHAR